MKEQTSVKTQNQSKGEIEFKPHPIGVKINKIVAKALLSKAKRDRKLTLKGMRDAIYKFSSKL